MFQCNLLDAGRRPGEFMYYYFSNHCKCDIVIRKYIMLLTCLGGGQDAKAKPFCGRCHHVRGLGIRESKFRNY